MNNFNFNYVFTLDIKPYVVTGHYILEKYYNSKKHGTIKYKDKFNNKLTRKKQNWYCRNYLDCWTFVH